MKRMGYLPYVGLPNILAGRFVVPEFLQHAATPETLSAAMLELIADPVRQQDMVDAFSAIHHELRQNTAERAAGAILDILHSRGQRHDLAMA